MTRHIPRLMQLYRKEIRPALKSEFKLDNLFAVPKIEKVVVNAGIGRLLQQNPKSLDEISSGLGRITGQKPLLTRAKKAISTFKIRQGQIVGLQVTLRGKRMYEFLDKFISAALPRTRDFRGLPKTGLDGRGNYSCGVSEHIVFPEMAQEDVGLTFGLEVTVVTTAGDDGKAYGLLKKMGFPFSA